MTFDPVQLVIDDELLRIARRWVRGVMVDDDALALEVIERVGHFGQFIDDNHTINHLRTGELLDTTLFVNGNYETWIASGAKDLEARVREKARLILKTKEVEPLPKQVISELDRIIEKARKSKGGG